MIKWLNLASKFRHHKKHRKLASTKYMRVFPNSFCIQILQYDYSIVIINIFNKILSDADWSIFLT